MAAGDHDNNAAVRNCTLEDIDAACLDFQQYELSYFIRDMEIATYVKDPVRGLGTQIEGGSGSQEDWFNCTHSQSQQQLHPEAVNYILGKIRL